MKRFILAFATSAALCSPVLASDIAGNWLRSDGEMRITMAPCGGAVCGHVAWLKNPGDTPTKVGQRVIYDLKLEGDVWAGKAFNPEDGRTYIGKASVAGSSMTTKGCVLGGLICKSFTWTRVR